MRMFLPMVAVLAAVPAFAGEPASPAEGEVAALVRQRDALAERVKALEAGAGITPDMLREKKITRLKELASDVKVQRQAVADFGRHVKWMSDNFAGYSKYISAGKLVAKCAKLLPIPYAGQASSFTTFVSQGALSLNTASVSVDRYLKTSQAFIDRVDVLDKAGEEGVVSACRLAQEELVRDMRDVQHRLSSASDLSTSMLSFLRSLEQYLGSADEYLSKTRALLGKDDGTAEKGFIAESIKGLTGRGEAFNARFRSFNESVAKDEPLIRSLAAYDELLADMRKR